MNLKKNDMYCEQKYYTLVQEVDHHRRPSNKGVSSMKETSTLTLDTCNDGRGMELHVGTTSWREPSDQRDDWKYAGIRGSGGEGQEVCLKSLWC